MPIPRKESFVSSSDSKVSSSAPKKRPLPAFAAFDSPIKSPRRDENTPTPLGRGLSLDDLMCTPTKSPAKRKSRSIAPILPNQNEMESDLYLNFKPGDFLYGLELTQSILGSLFKGRLYWMNRLRYKISDCVPIIIDTLNNAYLDSDCTEDSSMIKMSEADIQKQSPLAQSFYSFLSAHKKYSPEISGGKDLGGHLSPKEHEINAKIRRACKAGILFTISSQRTIHFLLSKIDNTRITSKKYYPEFFKGKSKKDHTITGSELRFIYRLWRDPETTELVDQYVKFYNAEGQQTEAPWKTPTHQEEWEEYEARIQAKHTIGEAIEEADIPSSLLDDGDYDRINDLDLRGF